VATPTLKKTKTRKVKVEETNDVEVGDGLDDQDSAALALQEQVDGDVELEREINFFEDASFGTDMFHVE
jgi:hypothetical protein